MLLNCSPGRRGSLGHRNMMNERSVGAAELETVIHVGLEVLFLASRLAVGTAGLAVASKAFSKLSWPPVLKVPLATIKSR